MSLSHIEIAFIILRATYLETIGLGLRQPRNLGLPKPMRNSRNRTNFVLLRQAYQGTIRADLHSLRNLGLQRLRSLCHIEIAFVYEVPTSELSGKVYIN